METMAENEQTLDEEIQFVNKNNHRFGHPSSFMAKVFIDKILKNYFV